VELAGKYLAPGYIQHNPNVETGLDGFVKFFSQFQPQPIQPTLKNPPIYAVANGDRVILISSARQPIRTTRPRNISTIPSKCFVSRTAKFRSTGTVP